MPLHPNPTANIWWHDYVSPVIELPPNGMVCFRIQGRVVEVRLDPQRGLMMRATDGQLAIHPRYANEILVDVEPFGES